MKSVIHTNKDKCYICHRNGVLHPHHIFNGPYRKKSEQDGMIVWVHDYPCHREIHDKYALELEIKQAGQRIWESMYGSRWKFIQRYGKNYLWKEED